MSNSAELTADAILRAQDAAMERVEVPEWGGHVYVGVMTGLERDRWEMATFDSGKKGEARTVNNVRASLAAATLRTAAGAPLFSAEQVEALGRKSGAALDRIMTVAQRINRLRNEDMEELAGNSAGVAGGDGSSNSPGTPES